jgi:hypothetical protein
MTENKILKLEFSARSEAAGKLTEQQSECLDHEIQTKPATDRKLRNPMESGFAEATPRPDATASTHRIDDECAAF